MIQCKHVLVLYVGGTIGMQRNEEGVYVPVPNAFVKKLKSSGMHDALLESKLSNSLKHNELILPLLESSILYKIKEYDPLLDSSNMSTKEWIRISKDIEKNYNQFDGFVILQGTDTLTYTSSILSFMLENLQKPVIITGSQIPIFEQRSDAKDNFLTSLIFAGCYDVPEVCVCFANKLLRGNRTTKISSNLLNAFDSPNYPRLGDAGINIQTTMVYTLRQRIEMIFIYGEQGRCARRMAEVFNISNPNSNVNHRYILEAKFAEKVTGCLFITGTLMHHHYIRKTNLKGHFLVHTSLDPHIGTLTFFPTITSSQLASFLKPPTVGLVLQTYGAGNIPSNRIDLLKVLREAINRGVVIVNISQCLKGAVSANYETGKKLEEIGVISGYDMTWEAALTKLIFVMGQPANFETKIKMLKSDLRGELTYNN